ncbi:hypothetical protein BJY52DRAFT_1276090 [Lactarius psammicola]|nr:hypothetical protein BJY52DRAFT_1276090 [Lactarius psammicola]
MLTCINACQRGYVSLVRHRGDFERCLGDMRAKVLVVPRKNDLYSPVRCIYFASW